MKEFFQTKQTKKEIKQLKCLHPNFDHFKDLKEMIEEIKRLYPNRYEDKIIYFLDGLEVSEFEMEQEFNKKISEEERLKTISNLMCELF